jgi:hypothetical protein
MMDLYAMRRANGDWFTFEDYDRLLVPIFHSSHDAFMARLRNVEMLAFSPVALDVPLLNELADGPGEVQFCMVNNPFASLKRGETLSHAQVTSLISSEAPPRQWKWLARPWVHD